MGTEEEEIGEAPPAAWTDGLIRERWLPDVSFVVRKATPGRSIRMTWMDGSRVDVEFYEKGETKSQVSVEHRNLPDREGVERQRAFWRSALGRMKSLLER